jgi:hypothetical protein
MAHIIFLPKKVIPKSKHHTKGAYRGEDVKLHTYILVPDEDEWLNSRFGQKSGVPPRNRTPIIQPVARNFTLLLQ